MAEITILYISKEQKNIKAFLDYIAERVKGKCSVCTYHLDKNILEIDNIRIAGKSIYGNCLGAGCGYCLYYCFSSKFDKSTYNTKKEKEALEQILMHTREGAREISEYEVMYMLGLLLPKNLASATQGILIDVAMPALREEIKSPLSPFRYKDELEKALNDFHFGNMFMNGA